MERTPTGAPGHPWIDRASVNDLTVLATDHGAVPMNLGAVLTFDAPGLPSGTLHDVLGARVDRVPRLRQRLRRTPVGCGRPIWVDDSGFSVDRHIVDSPSLPVASFDSTPAAETLATAAELVCRPLRRDRPLWLASPVIDHSGRATALIVVLHHVLADGIGGLAVLAALADEGLTSAHMPFPQPPPNRRDLMWEANRERIAALRGLPQRLHRDWGGLHELGVRGGGHRLAERTSLTHPTSHARQLATVSAPLDLVVGVAHRSGGTVNDVVLTAATGALFSILRDRGERPARLVVSVPISQRRGTTVEQLGNDTGVRPIAVPAVAEPADRLAAIVAVTGAARRAPERAASAAPLGFAFRALARLRLFDVFIDHQRLVHTFVTNVRGPAEALHLAGSRIASITPLVVTPGNVGVTFAVVSYAGQLRVAVIGDPQVVPEIGALADRVDAELHSLGAKPA
ncbi:MAG: DUF1298 domain-containing protein [Aldersonia sp.]|nr:DUF1298 domain-containing protein [Aldersonia sp.]